MDKYEQMARDILESTCETKFSKITIWIFWTLGIWIPSPC